MIEDKILIIFLSLLKLFVELFEMKLLQCLVPSETDLESQIFMKQSFIYYIHEASCSGTSYANPYQLIPAKQQCMVKYRDVQNYSALLRKFCDIFILGKFCVFWIENKRVLFWYKFWNFCSLFSDYFDTKVFFVNFYLLVMAKFLKDDFTIYLFKFS